MKLIRRKKERRKKNPLISTRVVGFAATKKPLFIENSTLRAVSQLALSGKEENLYSPDPEHWLATGEGESGRENSNVVFAGTGGRGRHQGLQLFSGESIRLRTFSLELLSNQQWPNQSHD